MKTFTAALFSFFLAAFLVAQTPATLIEKEVAAPEALLAPCSPFVDLACGQTYSGSTAGGGNDASSYACAPPGNNYSAQDRLFRFVVTTKSYYRIAMTITTPGSLNINLDMFLYNTCTTPIACIASSTVDNALFGKKEVLDVNLDPGTYYVMIDGTNQNFTVAFDLKVDCDCNCSEPVNDQPLGNKLFGDDFQVYNSNAALAAQSSRWRLWDETSVNDDATVITDGTSNQLAQFKYTFAGNSFSPNLIYTLDDKTAGRYRLSWNMKVATGKTGRVELQHTLPTSTGTGGNKSCELFFNSNGTGTLGINGPGTVYNFTYSNNVWTNVMMIVDIDQNRAEVWVNNLMVAFWAFNNNGSSGASNHLSGIRFWAESGADFSVDNMCVWQKNDAIACGQDDKEVCAKNGLSFINACVARKNLYTAREFGICFDVCAAGGTYIYRGDKYSGSFGTNDNDVFDECFSSVIFQKGIDPNKKFYSDVYIFYNENGDDINVSLNTSTPDKIVCAVDVCKFQPLGTDCERFKNCVGSFDPVFQNNTDVNLNACDNFYYIVVYGNAGGSYSNLQIMPNDKCPTNFTALTCGAPKTSGTLASGAGDAYFSKTTNGAYSLNYTGQRTYAGREKVYQIKLLQSSVLKATLVGAAGKRVGLFLFPFQCGSNCLGSAETTTFTDTARLSAPLSDGIYYLVVDSDEPGISINYDVTLDCTPYSPFTNFLIFNNLGAGSCPTNPTLNHTVNIAQSAFAFGQQDQVAFLFRDENNKLKSSEALTQIWGTPTPPNKSFNLLGSLSNSPKCSYAVGDSFNIFVIQTENGKRNYKKMAPTYASVSPPGVTAGKFFTDDAISLVTQLTLQDLVTFGTETSSISPGPDVDSFPLTLSATLGLKWRTELDPSNSGDWLTVTPDSSDGAERVLLLLNPNIQQTPRDATLRFYSVAEPDVYQQFVKVHQKGKCLTPSVNITSSVPPPVCAGTALTLSANVGTGLENLYAYKWSTGATTSSINVTPAVGANNYAVSITNKDCFLTASASLQVSASQSPATPMNPQSRTICAGGPLAQPLQVTVPGGQTVEWYTQSSGGTLVGTGASFTPSPLPANTTVYYARAKLNAPPFCSSANTVPCTLTVNPRPTLALSNKKCAGNLQTYSFTISVSNGNSLTASYPGAVISGNNGVFSVTNVPSGTNVTVTATNTANGCTNQLAVDAENCPCPLVQKPVSGGNKTICANELIPTLSVTPVGTDDTADWYDASNGMPLQAGTTTYTPSGAGVFFVKARNQTNQCTSTDSTVIRLRVNPLPQLNITSASCVDQNVYKVLLASNTSHLVPTAGTVSGTVANGFTISGINVGTNITVRAIIDSTGCQIEKAVNSPNCNCSNLPVVPPPLKVADVVVCFGQNIPPLQVTPQGNSVVEWYAQESGGAKIGDGPTLSATTSGTYYAEARNPANQCTSSSRTAVTLTINPLPAIAFQDTLCATNRKTYSVLLASDANMVSSTAGQVSGNSVTGFTISGIMVGQDIVATAQYNATLCLKQLSIKSPTCPCPPVAKPLSNGDVKICADQALLALKVSTGSPDETADWFNQPTGGSPLPGGAKTLSFLPPAAGPYFAQTYNLATECASKERTKVSLITRPLPTLSVAPAQCAPNRESYSVVATSNATSLTATQGVVTDNQNGSFTISGIPANFNVVLNARIDSTDCDAQLTVNKPDCSCGAFPPVLAPKGPAQDAKICENEPIPPLSVMVNTSETADWYDAPSGGNKLATGTPSYVPPAAGKYYAEARNTASQCVSNSRTEVRLIVNPLPTLSIDSLFCSPDFQFYNVRVSSNAPVKALPYATQDLGGGQFLVSGIPIGTQAIVTATVQATACKTQSTVNYAKENCSCTIVDAPQNIGDKRVCQGDPYPSLTVTVNKPNETADWFLTETGGVAFKFNTLALDSVAPGTYYAQTRNLDNGCVSASRTAVQLIVDAAPSANAGDPITICAGDEVLLSGAVTGVSSANWSAFPGGGSFFPGADVISGVRYTPPASASQVILTLTTADPAGPCVAVNDKVLLTILSRPVIVVDSAFCAADFKSYRVNFQVQNAFVSSNAGEQIAQGNGKFFIRNIPVDSVLKIEAVDIDNACAAQKSVQPPVCICPDVPQAGFTANVSICPEENNFPSLKVLVNNGLVVDWYDAETGGNKIETNNGTLAINVAGNYFAETRDPVTQCVSKKRTQVTASFKPAALADAGLDQLVCPGSTVSLTANPPGESYHWSNGALQRNIEVIALTPTDYTVTVTNAAGCTATDAVSVKVRPQPGGQINVIDSIACTGDKNGVLKVIPGGSAGPYSVKWSNGSLLSQIGNLGAGDYEVTITDAAGCKDTLSFVLGEPAAFELVSTSIQDATKNMSDGSIAVTVQGGVMPYAYQWYDDVFVAIPGETAAKIDSIAAGAYKLIATDAHGCTLEFNLQVLVDAEEPVPDPYFQLFPNPTTGLITLWFSLPERLPVDISVFSALGQEIQTLQQRRLKDDQIELDLSAQPAGLYVVRCNFGNKVVTKTVVLND